MGPWPVVTMSAESRPAQAAAASALRQSPVTRARGAAITPPVATPAASVAIALAAQPGLLLLDEPLAGAGVEEAARLIGILRALAGECTIVLVEHDMDAVFALADTVTVLAEGRILASGKPAEIRQDAAVRAVYLGDAC